VSSALDHFLMSLWAQAHEGADRDAEIHGQKPLSAEARAARAAEAARAGLAVVQGGEAGLTDAGEARARALLRRHRLAERLFSEVLELPESETERSACRLEHHLAERVADRICTLLGHPTTCPHGRLIPPGECCGTRPRTVQPIIERLTDLDSGDEARVVFLTPADGSRLDRLGALGISAGSTIRLLQKIPSFVVQAGETEVALDEAVAREVFVARAPRVGPAGAEVGAPAPARGEGRARGLGRGVAASLRRALLACAAIAVLASAAAEARAQVLMSEEEAVARILGPVDGVVRRDVGIGHEQRARIADAIGAAVPEERFTFIEGERGGEVVGWVYVGNEIGLYEPITFAVGITPEGTVRDVEILVYRESRGGEVSRRRFLNQYRGKGPDAPLRLDRDIINITGATVSSRSVTLGVRKALAAFRFLGVGAPPGPVSRAER
jgi:DtxR family Mn-dependent transcriptional regulator